MFPLGPRQSTGKVPISPSIAWLKQKTQGEFWSAGPRRQVSASWGTSAHPDLGQCGLCRVWQVPAREEVPPRPCPARARSRAPRDPAPPAGRAGQAAVRGAEAGPAPGCGTLALRGLPRAPHPRPGSCPRGLREGKGTLQRRLNCSCKLNGVEGEEVGFKGEKASSHSHALPAVVARLGTGEQADYLSPNWAFPVKGGCMHPHIQALDMARTTNGTRSSTPATCGHVDESPRSTGGEVSDWVLQFKGLCKGWSTVCHPFLRGQAASPCRRWGSPTPRVGSPPLMQPLGWVL